MNRPYRMAAVLAAVAGILLSNPLILIAGGKPEDMQSTFPAPGDSAERPVSKLARETVTVILSGVGGDEIFAGYRRYLWPQIRDKYRYVPGFIDRGIVVRS